MALLLVRLGGYMPPPPRPPRKFKLPVDFRFLPRQKFKFRL